MKYKCAIFDLDGTILNTIESIKNAVNKTMTIYGLPTHTEEEILTFINFGSVELVRRALLPAVFKDEKFDEIHNVYNGYLRKYSATMNKAYSGIENVCKELKENGVKICVMSNKPDDSAKDCINEYFSDGLFEYVRGSVPGKFVKPQSDFTFDVIEKMGVNKEDCILIGDSVVDYQTAENAELPLIWVSWGYGTLASLPQEPNYTANTPEDITKILL